jgi:lipid-A-disaccharide synthase-like uncharacterized protein
MTTLKKEYEYVRFEQDHFWQLLTPIVCLLLAVYYFIQFIRTRKTEKESKNGSDI